MEEIIPQEIQSVSKLEQRLAVAQTPQEANALRADIQSVRQQIIKANLDKQEKRIIAHRGAVAYCETSCKAGELWRGAEKSRGAANAMEYSIALRCTDVGFQDAKDAQVCSRISELDPQDRQIYYEDCADKDHLPTVNGLHNLWKQFNFVEDEDRPWLRVYNVWNFAKCDERFGMTHPGMIPGQIMQNLNWYFTKPGDLIVDLFAGGGSTIDVCRYDDPDFGQRGCDAYDIDPKRPDIQKRDVVTDGIPDISNAKLVFLDPPYWRQNQGKYGDQATNLANMELEEFHNTLVKIIMDCFAAIRPGTYLALIIGGSERLGAANRGIDHAAELIKCVSALLANRIIVPYSTQQYQAFDVVRAKKNRQLLNLYRDLIIWQKNGMAR